jgi:hypothetical protein
MAINFPLIHPATPGFRSISLRPSNAVQVATSPFTGQQQVQAHQGQFWQADVQLPPIKQDATADDWAAFLTALRGPYGTFLLGDSSRKTPRGSVSNAIDEIPRVSGPSQTGSSLVTGGWLASTLVLRRGDCIQVGGENRLKRSADFSHADWTKTNITISTEAIVAPDGTPTADKIEATATATTILYQTFTATADVITYSVFIKKGSGPTDANSFGVYNATRSADLAFLALNHDTRAAVSWTGNEIANSSWRADALGGGYYRLQITVGSGIRDGDSLRVYVGFSGGTQTAGKFVYAVGAQVNRGYYADPYIPATSAAVAGVPRLHKLVSDVWSNGSGNATLDIWPRLRESPADFSGVKTSNCQGTFRLASEPEWSVDSAKIYGIGFSAVEAI